MAQKNVGVKWSMSLSNIDYLRFKNLLEYLVAHLEYEQNRKNGKNGRFFEYIKDKVANPNFKHSGQGYRGNNIQDQIKGLDVYNNKQIYISIQCGDRLLKDACYIHWKDEWTHVSAVWNDNKTEITDLRIRFSECYEWDKTKNWFKATKLESVKTVSLNKLGLFQDNKLNEEFCLFYDSFEQYYYRELEIKNKLMSK